MIFGFLFFTILFLILAINDKTAFTITMAVLFSIATSIYLIYKIHKWHEDRSLYESSPKLKRRMVQDLQNLGDDLIDGCIDGIHRNLENYIKGAAENDINYEILNEVGEYYKTIMDSCKVSNVGLTKQQSKALLGLQIAYAAIIDVVVTHEASDVTLKPSASFIFADFSKNHSDNESVANRLLDAQRNIIRFQKQKNAQYFVYAIDTINGIKQQSAHLSVESDPLSLARWDIIAHRIVLTANKSLHDKELREQDAAIVKKQMQRSIYQYFKNYDAINVAINNIGTQLFRYAEMVDRAQNADICILENVGNRFSSLKNLYHSASESQRKRLSLIQSIYATLITTSPAFTPAEGLHVLPNKDLLFANFDGVTDEIKRKMDAIIDAQEQYNKTGNQEYLETAFAISSEIGEMEETLDDLALARWYAIRKRNGDIVMCIQQNEFAATTTVCENNEEE